MGTSTLRFSCWSGVSGSNQRDPSGCLLGGTPVSIYTGVASVAITQMGMSTFDGPEEIVNRGVERAGRHG
jgi:hypothetical protein